MKKKQTSKFSKTQIQPEVIQRHLQNPVIERTKHSHKVENGSPSILQQTNGNLNLDKLQRHQFIPRPSLLDDFEKNSEIKRSQFLGFYHCIHVLTLFYLVSTGLLKFKKQGNFIDTTLLQMIQRDFLLVVITWPMFYFLSYVAFFNSLLQLKNSPRWLLMIIQHGSQSCMFIYCHYLVLTRQLCMTHGAFITFQSCIFFMKMHSYTSTISKMRRQWIQENQPLASSEYEYPRNINIKNFTLFMWMPVLVYEPQYPRVEKIRPQYVLRKAAYVLGSLYLDYQITSDHILPLIQNVGKYSVFESIYSILVPLFAVCLITFFMVFENMLNFFAEITRFADRLFYQDWWNSGNFEEFNRKWNRPVHEFLYRHVYLEAIWEYKIKVSKAQLMTFTFSAMLHEYSLAVTLQQITPILSVFMLIQIPVIISTKNHKGTVFGNYFFWYGLIQGLPLIIIMYIRMDEVLQNGFNINFL